MSDGQPNPGITLFAIPKPFHGLIGTIQRNAVKSWTKLGPQCQIILLGDDDGVAEVSTELGLHHIPNIAVNDHGTPLVSDLFHKAEQAATSRVMCYVNADIILTGDFLQAIEDVLTTTDRFLMVGQRWDLDLDRQWDFDSPEWEATLLQLVTNRGMLHSKAGIDYFVYSRGLLSGMPPFAIGRTAWDNWIIARGRKRAVPVIDATSRVSAIHQNHDYGSFGSKQGMWSSQEAQVNQRMMGLDYATLDDVSHFLLPHGQGMRSAWTLDQLVQHPRRIIGRFPALGVPARVVDVGLRRSRSLRSTLKLTRSSWR